MSLLVVALAALLSAAEFSGAADALGDTPDSRSPNRLGEVSGGGDPAAARRAERSAAASRICGPDGLPPNLRVSFNVPDRRLLGGSLGGDVALDTGPVSSFAADCDSTGAIWAAVADLDTTVFLYRSTDLGVSWNTVLTLSHGCRVPLVELVVGPGDSSYVYLFYLADSADGDLWVMRVPLSADTAEVFPVAVGPDTVDDFSVCTDRDRLHYVYCLYANERRFGRTGSFTRSLDFGRTWEFPQDWWNCWDPHVTYSTGAAVHCTWRYALTGKEIHQQTSRFYGRPGRWWSHRLVLGGENDVWDPTCAAGDTGTESDGRMWVVANFAFLDTIPSEPDSTEGDTMPEDTIPELDTVIGLKFARSFNGGAGFASPGTLDTRLNRQWFPELKAHPGHPAGAVHLCYVTGTDSDPGKSVVYWRTVTGVATSLWSKPMKMNNPRANVLFERARPRLVCPPNAPHYGAGVLFSYYHKEYASGVYFDAPWRPGVQAPADRTGEGRHPAGPVQTRLRNIVSRAGYGVRFPVSGTGTWNVSFHDRAGRKLRSFAGQGPDIIWDGRDSRGRVVYSGVYFVIARCLGVAGRACTARLVVVD